jgi:hypothetical protein
MTPIPSDAESDPLDEQIKLLVTDQRGQFVIELPAGYRVTFGQVNPGSGQGFDRNLHCLRVWDGPGKTARLRAVFCDVRGIRDLSLPFARKIEKETGSAQWSRDDLGNFEQSSSRKMLEPRIVEGDDAW